MVLIRDKKKQYMKAMSNIWKDQVNVVNVVGIHESTTQYNTNYTTRKKRTHFFGVYIYFYVPLSSNTQFLFLII